MHTVSMYHHVRRPGVCSVHSPRSDALAPRDFMPTSPSLQNPDHAAMVCSTGIVYRDLVPPMSTKHQAIMTSGLTCPQAQVNSKTHCRQRAGVIHASLIIRSELTQPPLHPYSVLVIPSSFPCKNPGASYETKAAALCWRKKPGRRGTINVVLGP